MKQKNAIDTLLDEAKEKAGLKADNELAMAMGIKRQTISRYRKGQPLQKGFRPLFFF